MEIRPREVRHYETPDGREPFFEWFDALKDNKTKSIILERLDRLLLGNFGDYRRINGDLYELRIHYGAGFRVYYCDLDGVVVILLCGGAKKTQQEDIKQAKKYLKELLSKIL